MRILKIIWEIFTTLFRGGVTMMIIAGILLGVAILSALEKSLEKGQID